MSLSLPLSQNTFHETLQEAKDESIDTLGPLHTQAKSRDHEIVRPQKKVSKGHPKTS